MTRSVEQNWNDIGEILRKKELRQTQVEQLREYIADLLATPEGRQSIQKRLDGEGGSFTGRGRFVDEVARALADSVAAVADLTLRDRVAFQEFVWERTKPATDRAHWDLLWLLHREGRIGVGKMVLDSVAKITKKSDSLVHVLPANQAWKRLAPERIVTLLEVAKQASRDIESSNRLDGILSWARQLQRNKVPNEATLSSPTTSLDSPAAWKGEDGQEAPHSSGDRLDSQQLREPTVSQTNVDPVLSSRKKSAPTLTDLLAMIEGLFRRVEEEQTTLRQEREAAREALTNATDELKAQQELIRDYLRNQQALESSRNQQKQELDAMRDNVRRLEQLLTESRQQVEAVSRRADDYIHDATIARDNALLSFQAGLWNSLKAHFVEILDEPAETGVLNPDQKMFRMRLMEIRHALRSQGVPPI